MLHSGGAERWLVDLCPAGKPANLEMDIATVFPEVGLFGRRARELGIRVYHCEGGTNPFRFVSNLRRLLREHGPYDAVHCHLHAFSGFVLLGAWLEGVPARVAHSHNVVGNASRSLARRAYIALARILIRQFATAGMGPSVDSTADLFGERWTNDRRWRVMRCGISLEPFRTPAPSSVNKAAFGIPDDALVFGTIGRLTQEKNSEFLVEVLAAALTLNPATYLLMVGEGPLRETLERRAQDGGFSDRLKLAGTRTDVADVLRGAVDVFLFPSPPPPRGNEALPIAVVEAQAAGLPVVISDGVTKEAIVIPELVTQISADSGPEAWAATAISHSGVRNKIAAMDALSMIAASEFSCDHNIQILSRIYRNLEPEKRSSATT